MIPRRYLIRLAPWWILCVIVGSFMPVEGKAALGTLMSKRDTLRARPTTNHRVAHFLVFGSTALILLLIAETAAQEVIALLSVAGLGLAIELLQLRLLRLWRLEWWDIRDDTLAAVAVFLLIQWKFVRKALCKHNELNN